MNSHLFRAKSRFNDLYKLFFLEVQRCDDVRKIVRSKFDIWWFVRDLFFQKWYEYESIQWMHTSFAPNYDFLMSLSHLQFSKFFNFLKKQSEAKMKWETDFDSTTHFGRRLKISGFQKNSKFFGIQRVRKRERFSITFRSNFQIYYITNNCDSLYLSIIIFCAEREREWERNVKYVEKKRRERFERDE